MAAEMHRDVAMLDESADLAQYTLIQLPDSVVITPLLAAKLRAYHADGGKLLLSYQSGFDAEGRWALDFLPYVVEKRGSERRVLSYLLASASRHGRCRGPGRPGLLHGGSRDARAGRHPRAGRTGSALLPVGPRRTSPRTFTCLPALRRTNPRRSSRGNGFVCFADPIFREFRQTGNLMMRDTWHAVMNTLIGKPPFGDGLPKTMEIIPRRRDNDLLLTLLHYIPSPVGPWNWTWSRKHRASRASIYTCRSRRKASRCSEAASWLASRMARSSCQSPKVRLLLKVPGYFS